MRIKKLLTLGLVNVFLFLTNLGLFADPGERGERMMGGEFGNWPLSFWGYYGWIAMLVMALFVAGLTLFIVFLVRRGSARGKLYMDPLEELKARYARGEIERDEYLRMKDDLKY